MRLSCVGFALSTCLLVPSLGCMVGVPPVTLQAGTGARDVGDGQLSDASSLRAGIAPLAMVPSLKLRRLDFMAGYQHDTGRSPLADGGIASTTNAAFFSAGGYPLLHDHDGAVSRLGLFVQGRRLWDDATTARGWGTSLQLVGEIATFMHDGSSREQVGDGWCTSTQAHYSGVLGEGMLGVFVEAGYSRVGPIDIWGSMFGLSVRLPAAGLFGIGGGRHAGCTASR